MKHQDIVYPLLGQMPFTGDVRVVGVTEVEGILNLSLVPAEGKRKWKH